MSDTVSATTTIIVTDVNLRVRRINQMRRDQSGRVVNESVTCDESRDLLSYIVDIRHEEALEIFRTVIAGRKFPGGARSCRKVINTSEMMGDRWVILVGPHFDKAGAIDGIVYARFLSSEPEGIPQRDLDPEKFYEYLVENSSDVVFLLDSRGVITFVNMSVERQLKVLSSGVLGRHFSEIVHSDDLADVTRRFDQVWDTGELPKDYNLRVCVRSGRVRHLLLNGGLIHTNNGDRILSVCRDVTESVILRESLVARNKALSELNNILVELSTASTLDDGLRTALQRILNVLGLSVGAVSLIDQDGALQVKVAVGDEPERIPKCLIEDHSRLYSGEVIVLSSSSDGHCQRLGCNGSNKDANSTVHVPLMSSGAITAVLSIRVPSGSDLSRDKMDFLNLAGGILGPTIENARLQNDLSDRANLLAMLDRVAKSINAGRDVRSVLVACLQQVEHIIDFDRVSLTFVDESGETEIIRYWKDIQVGPIQKTYLSPEEITAAFSASSATVITDLESDGNRLSDGGREFTTGSAIKIPLKKNGAAVGLLHVWHRRPRSFGDRELRILEAVGEHLAIAASNARLYEAELAKSLELEAMAREAHHRIKNNLQMVAGLLSMCGFDQETENRAVARCLRQIKAMATVHDLLTPKSRMVGMGVRQCLTKVSEYALMGQGRSDSTELKVDGVDFVVSPDFATALSIIVNELVCNAAEHAFNGGQNRVAIWFARDENGAVIEVTDNGCGLPPEFVLPQSPDCGLGLVSSLATYGLGGTVSFENLGNGTKASIRF